jgi:hypothetical protein
MGEMSETKHTPEPWDYWPHPSGGVVTQNSTARQICAVTNCPEKDANGRLLGAAPDLLAALKPLAAVARRYLPDYDEHPEVQRADSAIAKAEGRKESTNQE